MCWNTWLKFTSSLCYRNLSDDICKILYMEVKPLWQLYPSFPTHTMLRHVACGLETWSRSTLYKRGRGMISIDALEVSQDFFPRLLLVVNIHVSFSADGETGPTYKSITVNLWHRRFFNIHVHCIFHCVACTGLWLAADVTFCCWEDFYEWICIIDNVSWT